MPKSVTYDELVAMGGVPVEDLSDSRGGPERTYTYNELVEMDSAGEVGKQWYADDQTSGDVNDTNFMQRASDRIQQYQTARHQTGGNRLSANEQVAIVDAYRQMAGIRPKGYYATEEGAVPRDIFTEIRSEQTDDGWDNFKANVSHTVLQTWSGINATRAKITDSLGITDDALRTATQQSEEISRILQPQGGFSGFSGQAVGNVMNLFMAGRAGAPAMFAVSTAGSTFQEVAQQRAAGKEVSVASEWTAAIANAAIEYTLERFGQRVAERVGLRMSEGMRGLFRTIAGRGLRGGVRRIAAVVARLAAEQVGGAAEGAAEEGITQILQNTVNKFLVNEEQGVMQGVGTAALQGAVMPMLASGPMAILAHERGGQHIPPTTSVTGRTLADSLAAAEEAPAREPNTVALPTIDEAAERHVARNHEAEGPRPGETPEQTITRLQEEVKAAKAEARTDTITGLGNRLQYDEAIGQYVEQTETTETPFSVILFDAANLKAANDLLGHEGANELLGAFGRTLRSETAKRAGDVVLTRQGGDEFAAILPGAGTDEASQVLARIESASRTDITSGLSMFLSGGIATYTKGADLSALLKEADQQVEQRKLEAKQQLGQPTTRAEAEALVARLKAEQPEVEAIPEVADVVDVARAVEAESRLPENLQVALPTETDIPSAQDNTSISHKDLIYKWIGDRQVADKKAEIEALRHTRELGPLRTYGEQAEHLAEAMAIYVDMKDNAEVYTPENIQYLTQEQQDAVERARNLSPEQRAFAEQIVRENRALGVEAADQGILENFRENYSARFWKKADKAGRRKPKFTISTERARQRTLPSIIHGWARGLELEVPSIIDAQMLAKQQIAQVIHDRNFVELGLKSGTFSAKKDAEHTHRIENPNFRKWVWAGKGEQAVGPDLFADGSGNLFRRAPLYADKATAKHLNNALGVSALYKIKGVGELTQFNAAVKELILTSSFFHHAAYLRSYMLGSRGFNPVSAMRQGWDAMMNFTPEFQELTHGGMTTGKMQDFSPAGQQETSRAWKAIEKVVPTAGPIHDALKNLSQANAQFLFGVMGPSLKTWAAIIEYRHSLKKNAGKIADGTTTREQIAADIANLMNDDFGGLNLQRMGRNPTTQHIFRLLALAPDWTESNIHTMVKAFKRGHEGKVYRDMWGRVLLKGVGLTMLANLLLSAADDESFLSRYEKAWKAGGLRWMDVDITPLYRALGGDSESRKYLSVFGHFQDPLKFIAHTGRAAKGKLSVIGKMLADFGTGTDWKGRAFTSLGDLVKTGDAVKYSPFAKGPVNHSQTPSYIIKQIEGSTPIQVQAGVQWLRGEIDGFDALTRSVGLPTKTAKPPKSTARTRRRSKRKTR